MKRSALCLVAAVSVAVAVSAAAVPAAAAALAPAATPTPIASFEQVRSAPISAPAKQQAFGTVGCPTGTVLLGGGVVVPGTNVGLALNASQPSTSGVYWEVFVNNTSTTAGTFSVYGDCARKTPRYHVVEATPSSAPAGGSASSTALCPGGTVVLGGGGYVDSTSTLASLGTTIPNAGNGGWLITVENGTTAKTQIIAYAICGQQPSKYSVVTGADPVFAHGTVGTDTATCPGATEALSGGGDAASTGTPSIAVQLRSSYPGADQPWIASADDTATAGNATVRAYAVCAQV